MFSLFLGRCPSFDPGESGDGIDMLDVWELFKDDEIGEECLRSWMHILVDKVGADCSDVNQVAQTSGKGQ